MANLKLLKDVENFDKALKEQLNGFFPENSKIAVKLHMGEKDNPYYLKPKKIKKIIDVLKELKLKPFLFDSIVLYQGSRDTKEKYYKVADAHGFTEEKIGCPIVISDEGVDVKTENLTVHVCKELAEADYMLVASHIKGHSCFGFGGAIKNLGMGGVTPKSKEDIHLSAGDAPADKLLAEGAQAVLTSFKKVFYVNFLINITFECDCWNDPGKIVADDIGVLFGDDIVAIDKASVDLIYRQKPGLFDKLHKKDPYLQIKFANELKMGETEYDIS